MKIEAKVKNFTFEKNLINALSSKVIVQSIEETVNDFANSCGIEDIEPVHNYKLTTDGLHLVQFRDDRLYDFITTSKNGCVVSDRLECNLTKRMVFPQYGDVQIRVKVDFICDLPEEDMEMFEIMGKVHTDVTPATIHKSVFCETTF